MFKLQIFSLIIVCFIAYLYMSSKGTKGRLHHIYSWILVVTIFHLLFDIITVYTVNNLDLIPKYLNDIFHRIFIGSMILEVYLFYCYIEMLIEEDSGIRKSISFKAAFLLVIFELGVLFLPVHYAITPLGNYSDGIHASLCYLAVGVYLFLCLYLLFSHFASIRNNKKSAILMALVIEIVISILQSFNPTWLISNMGIALIVLAFYLTLENPDLYKAQLIEQKMSMLYLKSQINPHFLYNTIDSIRIEAELNNDDKVAELLMKLVNFFRLTTKEKEQMVSIEVELDILENYMDLMCFRYPDLVYQVDVDPDLLSYQVPNFILQPLVENSLKYGLKEKGYKGLIDIKIEIIEDKLKISIQDSGVGMDEKTMIKVNDMLNNYYEYKDFKNSIGILNVQKRIKLLCGKNYGLSYENKAEGGLLTIIELPIME